VAGGNTAHFAAVIERLEARGLAVYACYSDLDAAPLIDHFFAPAGVQCLLNLSSFNLIGGHGRPDPQRAAALLERFDRPYLCAVPLVMQTIELWRASRMGLAPHQAVMQVAMPKLEGGASAADPAQADRMAARVKRWVDQRLRAEGYTIDLRESADALRRAVLGADTALPGPARGAWSSSR
jgi:cobalamin biosynthesis Mg chelatase CobN